MAMIITFMGIAFIFLLAVYVSNRTGTKANGNILLGVTLPHEALKDGAVNGIVKKYRRAYSLSVFAFLVLTAPIPFIVEYVSLSMLYALLWICAFLYVNHLIFNHYFTELYTLKRKNGWWVGAKDEISIDTEVSRLKNTFMISKDWFALPLVISMLPIIYAVVRDIELPFLVIAVSGIVILLTYFLIFQIINKLRTETYSENTEVNLVLNRVSKREWSKCLVVMATLSSGCFTAMSFMAINNGLNATLTAVTFIAICLIIIFPVVLYHSKIRAVKNRILLVENETVYTDNDLFWQGGIYNNPNDFNTFVEKRVGFGTTVNIASKGGKILIASIVPLIVLWLGIAVYILPFDFGTVTIGISAQTATINAPMNRFTFSANEVISVSMLEEMPHAGRVNHVSHGRIISGVSHVRGYGESHVFVLRGNAPYIRIELERGYVFLNGSTQEETATFFDLLTSLLP